MEFVVTCGTRVLGRFSDLAAAVEAASASFERYELEPGQPILINELSPVRRVRAVAEPRPRPL